MNSNDKADAAWDDYVSQQQEEKIEELERELNAANDRIKRLEAVVNDPHALWTNWLRGDVKLPAGIGDVRQYQQRIKRLEEAGDALKASGYFGGFGDAVNKWIKVREDKP